MSGDWIPTIGSAGGPKYLAILKALEADIRSGRLPPGSRLPPQRLLAKELCIDLTTVTRAFNEARRTGLIEATTGRGSFVRGLPHERRVRAEAPSASIDFSMNMPPQPEGARLAQRLSENQMRLAASPGFLARLQYQDSAGTRADRAAAAEWLATRLGPVSVQRTIIAAGAQAALHAILSAILRPGDGLCVPSLTYPGLRMVAERLRLRLLPIAADGQGILPEALAEGCRRHSPKALYTVPTIDNPTSATIPAGRREAIARIAGQARLAIVEDDAYGLLPATPPVPFAALAPDLTWHIATLSKCATPALRVAPVVVPSATEATRLAAELRAISLMASPLNAAIAASWMEDGSLDAIITAIREENGRRQDLASRILHGFDVAADPAGPHLWLKLPSLWDRASLAAHARQLGLSVVASDAFSIEPGPEAIRVSLGAAPELETVQEGLGLLATLLSQAPGAVSTIV